MTVDAWARWIGPDVVLVHFPYDAERVHEFKRCVPPRFRRWLKGEQAWRVRWPYAIPVTAWLLGIDPLAEVTGCVPLGML